MDLDVSKDNTETRTLMLMALLALWLAAWAYSVVLLVSAEAAVRMVAYFGWQGVAGMIAFGCWGIGWSFAKGSGIRRISAVPLAMAFALVLVVIGMAVFAG